MSIDVMSRVWEHSTAAGAELLLLLAVADAADDSGKAYPAVATLARKARCSPRSVRNMTAKLRERGELSISIATGPNGCNEYLVIVPAVAPMLPVAKSPKNPVPRQELDKRGGKGLPGGGKGLPGGVNMNTYAGRQTFAGGRQTFAANPVVVVVDPNSSVDSSDLLTDKTTTTTDPARAEQAAIAAALLDRHISASPEQAAINAAALLAEYSAEWIIRAAVETGERRDVKNPYAYLLGILARWSSNGGPHPTRAAATGEQTEEDRRRKYDPEFWAE